LISEGRTWRDASEKVISRIKSDPVAFLKTVSDWMEGQQ
jgi:hypothetical protein